jgi:anion-transporting  ArsA/GET3 family ATPase
MLEILSDPQQTAVAIVTTPEEMPVNETIELVGRVRDETSVELASVMVNRVLPELFGRSEEEVFDKLCASTSTDELTRLAGDDPTPVLTAARLAVTLRRTHAGHLERLRAAVDPAVPMLYLPFLFARFHGLRTVRQVAHSLGEELGF